MALRQLAETLCSLRILKDGRAIENKGLASGCGSLRALPAAHAGPDPFDDQVALQFGDRSDDDDNSSAPADLPVSICSRKLMYSTLSRFSWSSTSRKCFTDRAIRSESPDLDDVELTPAGVPHQRIESGPLGFGSADPVGILFDDLIPTLLGHLTEVIELGLRVLVEGGDSQVECGALHRGGSECNTHI